MAPEKKRVVVMCAKCGAPAPYAPPRAGNPYGLYYWHQPCQKCGAEAWGAHDTIRDITTGRIREPVRE